MIRKEECEACELIKRREHSICCCCTVKYYHAAHKANDKDFLRHPKEWVSTFSTVCGL